MPTGTIGKMLNDLSGDPNFSDQELHLDPDLQENAIEKRKCAFKAAFGQCGGEQSHLENPLHGADIGENTDLFLFFGYFRRVHYDKEKGRWKYQDGNHLHLIHSWMQVGTVHRIDTYPNKWSNHPHGIPSFLVRTDQQRRKPQNRNNTIYTPRERLTFNPDVAGYGVFSTLHERLQITDPAGRNRTDWRLPVFFNERLSHIGDAVWCRDGSYCHVTQRGYGQEFILDLAAIPEMHQQILEWLTSLPFHAARQRPSGRGTAVAQRV